MTNRALPRFCYTGGWDFFYLSCSIARTSMSYPALQINEVQVNEAWLHRGERHRLNWELLKSHRRWGRCQLRSSPHQIDCIAKKRKSNIMSCVKPNSRKLSSPKLWVTCTFFWGPLFLSCLPHPWTVYQPRTVHSEAISTAPSSSKGQKPPLQSTLVKKERYNLVLIHLTICDYYEFLLPGESHLLPLGARQPKKFVTSWSNASMLVGICRGRPKVLRRLLQDRIRRQTKIYLQYKQGNMPCSTLL